MRNIEILLATQIFFLIVRGVYKKIIEKKYRYKIVKKGYWGSLDRKQIKLNTLELGNLNLTKQINILFAIENISVAVMVIMAMYFILK